MNSLVNKIIVLIVFLSSVFVVHAQVNKAPFVIPALQQWKGGSGFYRLADNTNLVVSTRDQSLQTYLQTFLTDLQTIYPGKKFEIRTGQPRNGDIYFSITGDTARLPSPEGYILTIDDYVSIEATQPIGAFWATRTLLQILEQDAHHVSIPKGIAKDYPLFPIRGFVLDVGRKYFTIDFLRDYVKFMSYYKMNDFQIHLNDNGFKQFFRNNWDSTYAAFRLENETYPGLTAKDGAYSKKEFIELQKLANGYGVNIVPEIDVPAHALSITKAVPQIGSAKYGMDHLDIHNPYTYTVVDNIFKEYLEGPEPVFIGKEVHIGTDEYAREEAEKFRGFTDHYIRYVESFGKKLRLWGALTHAPGSTPVKVKDVTMNVWYNGYADPKEMLKLGYDVISTPDGWLYIVPKAGYYFDYLDLKNIYSKWTPNVIGDQTFEESNKQIKGGSFAVWNDHVGNGITGKDVHDRVFPAMQVLAQKMWIGSKVDLSVSYDSFKKSAAKIGEGPGLNIRGKISGKNSLILAYSFSQTPVKDGSGNRRNAVTTKNVKPVVQLQKKAAAFTNTSVIETPITGIGYNYTVSFYINPAKGNEADAVLFSSKDAVVKLKQGNSGKLGFSREGYDYHFNYVVRENVWTHIIITGNSKGTSLYVNGNFVEKLEGAVQEFNGGKDKIAKQQTLFFPLQYIGDGKNSFTGCISSLKVYNNSLSPEAIKLLAQ
ncbi:family 20 glycosylhydrolase [Flavihumibacter petaseus]|nr:family 20 glycosylhydrolase [Flavihumibacter petaseus]